MRKISFKTDYVSEEPLVFGGQEEEQDPRLGLKHFGPYQYKANDSVLERIRVGIVGNAETISQVKAIIDLISNPIESKDHNRWLHPAFPGMSRKTKFNCVVELNDVWQSVITESEISRILGIKNVNERIGSAVDLYLKKIDAITSEDNPPELIICSLPKDIEKYCGISEKTRGAKQMKLTPLEKNIAKLKKEGQLFLTQWGIDVEEKQIVKQLGFDFRNALKGKNMSLSQSKPIQLIRESTMQDILNYSKSRTSRQAPAEFAWNFSTALFYKANGKPWRLAKLRQDTCYVGISFYRDKLDVDKEMQTSMAQVFTSNGEGLVLRGTDVYIDESTKEPHLTENQAYGLLKDSIERYISKASRSPSRVVLHKSTHYTAAEQKGFGKAIAELCPENAKKDLVVISKRNGVRFVRDGAYPVLRGTLISLDSNSHLLYTSGYVSRIRTYPGHSIPQPLLINHVGDSEIHEIAREILGLTKLNWNTTAFATYLPITLEFSGKVGKVLSELEKGANLQNHYKFYM